MIKIVIATHNPGKLSQFKALFQNLEKDVNFLTLSDIAYKKEIEETGTTYEENSLLKATTLCKETGIAALGEDSGLEIDALPNQLGLFTARFGKGMSKEEKLTSVLNQLKDVPWEKRTARFVSVISCVFPDGHMIQTKGEIRGHITQQIVNIDGGMSYTPIFIPEGSNLTLSQLSEEELVKVNHRGIAARKFVEELKQFVTNNQ